MTTQTALSPRAWRDLILLSVIWGASFLAIRTALDDIPVLTTVAHRVLWAALALWLVVWASGARLPRSPRLWVGLFVMGALNNALPFSFIAWGQLHIETGLTSILNASAAIWGVLVAALVFADERLTPRKFAGVALGFLGVLLAIGLDSLRSFDLRSLAQLAVIAAALCYAVAGSFARARLSGLSPVVAAAGMLTGASLIMVPLAWVMDGPPQIPTRPDTLLAIAYFALISTALAYLLYYRVLAMAGSGNLLLCTLLVAPVAIVLGAAVRGEALAPSAFAGFALLALGLLVLDGRILRAFRKPSAT